MVCPPILNDAFIIDVPHYVSIESDMVSKDHSLFLEAKLYCKYPVLKTKYVSMSSSAYRGNLNVNVESSLRVRSLSL